MKRKQLNLNSNYQSMGCVRIEEEDEKILNYKFSILLEKYGDIELYKSNVELHKKMNFYYVVSFGKIYWFKSLEKATRFYHLRVFAYDLSFTRFI